MSEYRLPILVAISQVRNSYYGNRQSMLVEVIDAKTGQTIGVKDNILPDRIVNLYYDPQAGRIELRGLKCRIDIDFGPEVQRLHFNRETL